MLSFGAGAQRLTLTGSLKSRTLGTQPITMVIEKQRSGRRGEQTLATITTPVLRGGKPVRYLSDADFFAPPAGLDTVLAAPGMRVQKTQEQCYFFEEGGKLTSSPRPGNQITTFLAGIMLYRQGSGVYFSGELDIKSKARKIPGPFGSQVAADSLHYNVVLYPPRKSAPAVASLTPPTQAPSKPPSNNRPATAQQSSNNRPTTLQPSSNSRPTFDTTAYNPLYWWNGPELLLDLWDNYDEDGDAVQVQWDDDAPVSIALLRVRRTLTLALESGRVHALTFTITGEGQVPGNTASVAFYGGPNKPLNRTATGTKGQTYRLYFARRD